MRAREVALVTGGASGIGAALARRLAAAGADVVVVDLSQSPAADAPGRLVHADVSDAGDWERRIVPALDRLDVACLNAGIVSPASRVDDISADVFERVVGVNAGGVVHGVRALAPLLERDGGGAIVVTASLAGLVPMANDPLYAATKHFLVGFVRSIAPQLAERGVRINAVCPGIVDTPLLGDDGRRRLEEAGFPLLTPDDVAAAAFAALERGGTGQAWVCQPGRVPEPYRFQGVPGPRVAGYEGVRPPI